MCAHVHLSFSAAAAARRSDGRRARTWERTPAHTPAGHGASNAVGKAPLVGHHQWPLALLQDLVGSERHNHGPRDK